MTALRFAAGTALFALAVSGAGAMAQTDGSLAAKFGARRSVLDVSISPEGKQVVLVAPRPDGGENAVVVSLETGDMVPILGAKGNTERIGNCQFVIESRVLCQLLFRDGSDQSVVTANRLVVLANDGSSMEQLTADARGNTVDSNYGGVVVDYSVADNPNAVLVTRWFNTEGRTGNIGSRGESGLAVEAVDVVTMSRRRVEPPRDSAFWYASDGHGNVRLMGTQPTRTSGYARLQENYSFRPVDGSWTDLGSVTFDRGLSRGFNPVAVDASENVAYGFDSAGDLTGLYKMALDGSGTKTLVLGRDDVDVDGLLRIGRSQRIVGASYATDRRLVEYFDPELQSIARGLDKALGGGKQIDFVDATADESKLVVLVSSDQEPGKYYLYDKATKQLAFMMNARDQLAGVALSEMRPVQYPAADGTMIPAYLTLPPGSDGKNIPAIVMPHGGPGSRDEWGFDWLSQYFAARGFAVLQPNFRGSAGYGNAWFQENGFRSWETAVGDVNSAGRWLAEQGIAAPDKMAIVGWSYGGYAALQSQVLDPSLYKAVVAIAPVADLERLMQDDRDQGSRLFTENFVGNGPHVEAGSPAQHAGRFEAPVLLFHGDADLNVGVGQSRLMNERLRAAGKPVTYVEFDELDHQLDTTKARTRLLSESDAFLRTALGL